MTQRAAPDSTRIGLSYISEEREPYREAGISARKISNIADIPTKLI